MLLLLWSVMALLVMSSSGQTCLPRDHSSWTPNTLYNACVNKLISFTRPKCIDSTNNSTKRIQVCDVLDKADLVAFFCKLKGRCKEMPRPAVDTPCHYDRRCFMTVDGNPACICHGLGFKRHCIIEDLIESEIQLLPHDRVEVHFCTNTSEPVCCAKEIINVDQCASNPCLNGGTCVDGEYGFTCNCVFGFWTGALCETAIDPCDSTPCQNGGTCTPVADYSSYSCSCPLTAHGVNCETSEWIPHGGRSYYRSTTKCSYPDCRAICLGLGADLVTIESAEEQTFVASIAYDNFWLSIYETTGTWVVNQDSTQEIAYTSWHSSNPDVASDRCAVASRPFGFAWFHYPCDYYPAYALYICEK